MEWVRGFYGGLKDKLGTNDGRIGREFDSIAGVSNTTGGGTACPAVAFAVFAGGGFAAFSEVERVLASAAARSAEEAFWRSPGKKNDFFSAEGFDGLPGGERGFRGGVDESHGKVLVYGEPVSVVVGLGQGGKDAAGAGDFFLGEGNCQLRVSDLVLKGLEMLGILWLFQ